MTDAETLRSALLGWYDANARDLPWRQAPTPYNVLLSEMMLQQTRVDTALPYFHRFLDRWPTLADLAGATEEQVVEQWAGLGYYRRARFLHRAAVAASDLGGLPNTVDELRKLPGIGPYTAGAIGSIAFGLVTPLVDGNVERVLSRVDDRGADPRSKDGRRELWGRATELVDPERPGDSNQALMELGALVCKPRNPNCPSCPWETLCTGQYRATELPKKAPRKKPVPIREVAAIVRGPGGWLLGRRPTGGMLAGLWEPLRVTPHDGEGTLPAAERALLEGAGLRGHANAIVGSIVHVFSHRRLTLDLVAVEATGAPTAGTYADARWTSPEDVALSSLAKKAITAADVPQTVLSFAADSDGH
ncbi:MAG: A/G-specific adenine glycosylase [Proteobacteria bacterium]|nr:A/G-specific adenine glycosylase [Pseudomonadota bacterium]